MRALVMAAGLGTRLRPLTERMPKPLVPLLGRPMIEYVLAHLAHEGIKEARVNIHYLPEQLKEFVANWNAQAKLPQLFLQDESAQILNTGGAVALAAPWLFENNSTALICNSDVVATPDLAELERKHRELAKLGVECTLAAIAHPEAGKKYTGLRLDGDLITNFESSVSDNSGLYIFPGFYLLEKSVVKRMPSAGTAFSIMEKIWQPLMGERKLGAWVYQKEYLDLGTPEDLQNAEKFLRARLKKDT